MIKDFIVTDPLLAGSNRVSLKRIALLCRSIAVFAALSCAGTFVWHLAHQSQAFLGLFEDDYYFYAVTADRFVSSGKPTFDGTTITNGFHPLWFAILSLLRALCGRFGPAFHAGLALIFFGSMLATYELLRSFARALGASEFAAPVIAVLTSFGTFKLLCGGMETCVGVPLGLWLLVLFARTPILSPRRAFKLGAVAALAALGRLDSVMLIALLLLVSVVLSRLKLIELVQSLLAFAAGGFLLAVYLAANVIYFHSLLPMSALAKRLQTSFHFSLSYLIQAAYSEAFGLLAPIVISLGALALLYLARRGPGRRRSQLIGFTAIAFAGLFMLINATSGWLFFGWYAYPLPAAIVAGLVYLIELFETLQPRFPRLTAQAVASVSIACVPIYSARYFLQHGPGWTIADNSMLAAAYELKVRLQGRPGLLAMGAMSGMATYVMDRPLFQLEGLVGDKKMIDHLKHRDPLPDVLQEHGADYLIVNVAHEKPFFEQGCLRVIEPNPIWSGPWVANMRGEICGEPVAHFFVAASEKPWAFQLPIEAYVFDLHRSTWR